MHTRLGVGRKAADLLVDQPSAHNKDMEVQGEPDTDGISQKALERGQASESS